MHTYHDLSKRIFKIPENQRGFAWEEAHLNALINDLKITRELDKNHYVGPIVIESLGVNPVEDNELNALPIVSLEDGQQRITTMAIISKYLSGRLIAEFNIGDPEYQSGLNLQKCYKRKLPGVAGDEFTLIKNQNVEFHQMTEHILLGKARPALESSPLRRMNEMNTYVEDWVNEIDTDDLMTWSNEIQNRTYFVKIDLDEDINKYLAFDAINSRGVTLTVFDKVKNFCCLITNLRALATNPETEWINALKHLESANVSDREDEFITDIYNVAHGVKLNPDKVHSKMVEEYRSLMFAADLNLSDKLEEFIGNWERFAKSFAFVTTNNRAPYYPGGANISCNATAKKWMDKFDNLDYRDTCRALLATTHWKFNYADFATVVEYCEKFAFRVYGVINKPTDTNRGRLIITAHKVYSGNSVRYVKSVICYLCHHQKYGAPLKSVIGRLGDGGPKYPFVSDGWDRCYYLLYEYDQKAIDNIAWAKNKSEQGHTMEHIMPKADIRNAYWNAEWPDDHQFEKFRHRLGNLVLTRDRVSNSYMGTKSIDEKIDDPVHAGLDPGYDYSNGTNSEKDIHTHADFTGPRQWKKENILHREKRMLRWAAIRWELPCCDDKDDFPLPEEFVLDGDDWNDISPGFREIDCIDARGPEDEELGQEEIEVEADQMDQGGGFLARRLRRPDPRGQEIWIEHTQDPDRPDRATGERALGKAIWSPQLSRGGSDVYRLMRNVRKGDLIIHLAGTKKNPPIHIRGVSIVKSAQINDDCKGIKGTNWDENTPCYLWNLEDYRQLDLLMESECFLNEENWGSLEEIRKRRGQVFYDREHNLRQGGYLTPCVEGLASLLNDAHIEFSGKALPHFEEAGGAPEEAGSVSEPELSENDSEYSVRQKNFGSAWKGDEIVFGSERPNYGSGITEGSVVEVWIPFMETKGIARVVCLLTEKDLEKWDSKINLKQLERIYQEVFGAGNVCMAGIPDRDICTEETMNNDIIPFLKDSVELELKTDVHCSAGMGRTGHVLAAWRYCHHDVEYKEAMLSNNWECEDGRDPREAKGKPSDHLGRKVKESDYQNLLKSAKSGYDFL